MQQGHAGAMGSEGLKFLLGGMAIMPKKRASGVFLASELLNVVLQCFV